MNEKKSRTTKDDRTRNWTFVAYPESVLENWRDILDDEHIQWVESPLHDKDLNADGQPKKPHWHILLLFEGNKSFEQVKTLTEKLNATVPQKCASAKGLVRYMAHLDNPEKVQYDRGMIIGHGGVDVAEYLKPTSSTRYQLIGEMMDFVRDNDITELEDLAYYARVKRFEDWFPLLCDNSAYIMGEFIKSRRNRGTAMRTYIDRETGEIIETEKKEG